MDYQNGDSITSTVFNVLARRKNGIRNLDPTHAPDEGPCAVTIGTGQSAVELDVSGGTPQIDGVELTVHETQVTLADNTTDDQWRQDIVYIAESGEAAVLAGETAINEAVRPKTDDETGDFVTDDDGNVQWEVYRPEGAHMAVPEPVSTAARAGAVLARVTVPPGASTSQDLDAVDRPIQDLRTPALRERLEPWQNPVPIFGPDLLAPDEERVWSTTVRPGQAFELYAVSQNHSVRDWYQSDGIVVELRTSPDGITNSNAEVPFSNDGGFLRGDPIERIEVPDSETEGHDVGLVQRHDGDSELGGEPTITLSAAYRILPM